MNRLVKIFNKLIQHKLSPVFGDSLLDCKLIGRDYQFGDYRYDLIFVFRGEYNNPMIQLESVLETCDMLFDWVDLRDMVNLSIVIVTEFGRTRHFSYFELMDEIIHSRFQTSMYNHPMYQKYREWESNKLLEERRRRDWETEWGRMETTTRNDFYQESKITESRKKKFLFW